MLRNSLIVFNERTHTFDCAACLESVEIAPETLWNPEAFLSVLELTQLDHHDCGHYLDTRMAQSARAFYRASRRQRRIRTGSASALA